MNELELTGVILAGGLNKRMGGQTKGLLPFPEQPIIRKTINEMKRVCNEILLVVNNMEIFSPFADERVLLIKDVIPELGPLGGLHTSLLYSKSSYLWMVGSDMPYVSADVALWMLSKLKISGKDLVMPMLFNQPQPLHAIYHQKCFLSVDKRLNLPGKKGLIDWHKEVNVQYISEDDLINLGLPLNFSEGFNTPEEYQRLIEGSKKNEKTTKASFFTLEHPI